ncbi:MAG: DNA polymerase III subunit delta' [Mariprofundales bacterium]
MTPSTIHGHTALRAQLLTAITASQQHHAWLLHGPMGIGKSLLAHEMAQAFLCQESAPPRPCLHCHSCTIMAADSHPDLLLLQREESKRDIPVSQVRQLLDFISLTGYESNRRVVIIDDAERLNNAAANALLKGLEEPAQGCLIIMVCSDLQRLPATVRSRCMMQVCNALDEPTTRTVLQQIGIADSALDMATTVAQGQPGRSAFMCDDHWSQHLQKWHQLTKNIAQLDIGELQKLTTGKWPAQPLALAAFMVQEQVRIALHGYPFAVADKALSACQQLAEAPARVERQSIRCDQALLGPMIELRRIFSMKIDD